MRCAHDRVWLLSCYYRLMVLEGPVTYTYRGADSRTEDDLGNDNLSPAQLDNKNFSAVSMSVFMSLNPNMNPNMPGPTWRYERSWRGSQSTRTPKVVPVLDGYGLGVHGERVAALI